MFKQLKIILLLLTFIISLTLWSQNDYNTTEEVQIAADEFFEHGHYTKAFPLYSQLLSLDRENPILNYRFGVCLLYSDRSDTYAPIMYLKNALKEIEDPDIYYYLGFAYHINYNFPAAISYYKDYQNRASEKKKPFDVERQIEMCQNGMELLKSVTDLFVMQKSEVNREEFFRSYDLRDFGGRMIKKPENFKNKVDAKSQENDFIFFNSKASEVYYAAYGKNHKDQKDIYRRSKLKEGGWSPPMRLPSSINTPYDEDFAVMMPDGKTLYFSSKGHNTIGGYDIFKSVFDEVSRTWSIPENINFPFNTPVDDILFISDTTESEAWFASVRNSVDEKIMVYKVGIIKRPEGSQDLAAIYAKNRALNDADLGGIKDKAKLDVNISEQEYQDIPVLDNIPFANADHLSGEEVLAQQLKKKQLEQQLIDSASSFIQELEHNIHDYERAQQQILAQADIKKEKSANLKQEVINNLKLTQETTDLQQLQSLVQSSNFLMAEAERLDFELIEMDGFVKNAEAKIEAQKMVFQSLNKQYGDAERAIINDSLQTAEEIIDGMQKEWNRIYYSSDQNASIAKQDIQEDAIQYPQELEDISTFKAFAINDQNNDRQQVEAFDSRFEIYLPITSMSDTKVENTGFSEDPFVKVEEYLTILKNKSKSLNADIAAKDQAQTTLLLDFSDLTAEQKENQLMAINQNAEEKAKLQSELIWVEQSAENLGNTYAPQDAEINDNDLREEQLSDLTNDLEQTFDFQNQTFSKPPKGDASLLIPTYVLNDQGFVEESDHPASRSDRQNVLKGTDPQQYLESTTAAKQAIQTTIAQTENRLQQVSNTIDRTRSLAQTELQEANQSLSMTKSVSISDQPSYLDETNKKFDSVYQYITEISSYQVIQMQWDEISNESNALMVGLEEQKKILEEAIQNQEDRLINESYHQINAIQQDFQVISSKVESLEQEMAAIENDNILKPVQAYRLTKSGLILKSFGEDQEQWSNIDSFEADLKLGNNKNIVYPLAANIGLEPQLALGFQQNYSGFDNAEQVMVLQNKIDDQSFGQSAYPLVQNALKEMIALQDETQILLTKRNQLSKIYYEKEQEAIALENQSIVSLQSGNVGAESLLQANQQSYAAKKLAFQASELAKIMIDLDRKILKNSLFLADSDSSLQYMKESIDQGNQETAFAINQEIQKEIEKLDELLINDQNFNYPTSELTVQYPSVFEKDLLVAYTIENGQIQKNRLPAMASYLINPSTDIQDIVAQSPLITKEDRAIVENRNRNAVMVNSTTNEGENSNQNLELANNPITEKVSDSILIETSSIAENNNSVGTPIVQASQTNASHPPVSSTDITPSEENQEFLVENQPLEELDIALATESELRASVQQKVKGAQGHLNEVNALGVSLTNIAEQKIMKSNELTLLSEETSHLPEKKQLQDSAKLYLYQALAMKSIIEEYHLFEASEKVKKDKIDSYALQIDTEYNMGHESKAKEHYSHWKSETISFVELPEVVLKDLIDKFNNGGDNLKMQIDSSYALSQEKANESVQLITEAAQIREKANGKRNAFKRKALLDKAESTELLALQMQNESENALNHGNSLYQQSLAYASLSDMDMDFEPEHLNQMASSVAANRAVVFESIESKKETIIHGQFSSILEEGDPIAQGHDMMIPDDIHLYERENFKAEMISEELELVKREIALLLQSKNKQPSEVELTQINQRIDGLRIKADSLEYEANSAFELSNRVLATLSDEDQKKARKSSRDFEAYLADLKGKTEILLSEASSYKQRAQKTNNIESKEELMNQARAKEEVAILYILEEFEVVAQKNKTRYRKNQLILEQMLMDQASPLERELMRHIFAQIDDYFEEAQVKRDKANEEDISFNMKKILLQDAYSLEMKALDLQIKAKSLLKNNNIEAMMALQSKDVQEAKAWALQEQRSLDPSLGNQNLSASNVLNPAAGAQANRVEVSEVSQEGLIYKVQLAAIRDFVPNSYFLGVTDITAELVTGTDFIRYFSGEFSDLNNAIIRRNNLRLNGYPDAFIRSWRDGEAVSLMDLQAEDTQVASALSQNVTERTSINNVDFSATNISALQGLYYTIQIGVFSRPRTSSMIFDVKPLYHKRLDNGYWVYYSGIFKSIADANLRKDQVVRQGVSDAFIIAFNNGEPIDLYTAQQELNSGGTPPLEEDIVILEDASLQIENDWNLNQNANVKQELNSNRIPNSEIPVFKVQVGVYSNQINLEWISSQMDENMPIEFYQSSTGKYIYTIGNYPDITGARGILNEVRALVPDAFIVSFQNGTKTYIGN